MPTPQNNITLPLKWFDPALLPDPRHNMHGAHPMITSPSGWDGKLQADLHMGGFYRVTFSDQTGQGRETRIFAMAFHGGDHSNPVWTASIVVPPNATAMTMHVNQAEVCGSAGTSTLWFGAWMNDGSFGEGTRADVLSYFAHHPEGGEHHTVPIIVT